MVVGVGGLVAPMPLGIASADDQLTDQSTVAADPTDRFPRVTNSDSEAHLLPLPAEDAAATMQLPPGFRATVFAAEPDVQNPIAMAWDARGRLWVAENYTYSDRTERFDLSLRDRVLVFEDVDHDGRADRRRVFTDEVQLLTSVEVGRGGVWLMCPPQLLFFPDADGDDVPDGPAEVMLDGFEVAQDSYHNFANGLRWGPDGWLYGRCGHSCPGRLGVPGTPPAERVPIDGGIWRFHPERRIVEVICHGTVNPWGHDWDEHGELFFTNTVIGHLWHAVAGAHFKESFGESMNPDVYERMDMIADHYHFDTRYSAADSRDGRANDLGGGHAHIGAMIYQGGHWPNEYQGRLLTLNMHGLRANVERLERHGSGYVGRHAPDFFVSRDPFFRGIDLSTGPDGNVFVIDWSDTGECHEYTGVHRLSGRVFKISYGESRPILPMVKPSCLQGAAEAVRSEGEGSFVLTAASAVERSEAAPAGDGRLPQLWRDYQAGRTTPESLRALELDADEHVRVWAIRLLTDLWPLDWITGPSGSATYPDDSATREMLVRMARDDSSGLVHRVLASTLQRLPVAHRAELAGELVRHPQHAADRDLPLLVWYGLISVGHAAPQQLVTLAGECRWPHLTRLIARHLASQLPKNPEPLNELLKQIGRREGDFQVSVLQGMHDACRGWRTAPKPAHWDTFARAAEFEKLPAVLNELHLLFGDGRALTDLRRIARDETAEMSTRVQALQAVIEARPEDLRAFCESLLDVRILNAAAAQGLALFDDPEVSAMLARKYRRFQAEDRPRIIETLVSRPGSARVLLDELASGRGQIRLTEITAAHARQMQSLGDESLTRKLAEVWGDVHDTPAEKRQRIAELTGQLRSAVLQQADMGHGRLLFMKTCSSCHRLYGQGQPVGPDLTGSQRSSLDYLLSHIVDPSAVVGKDFRMSIVVLADGRVLNGLVVSRDEQTLVLRTATEQLTLAAADVEAVQESTRSAMPDGLLQNLSPAQIRDLVAYLMSPVQVPLPDGVPVPGGDE